MNDLRVCLVCDNFLPNHDGVVSVVINYHKYFLKHAKSLLVVPKIGKTKPINIKNIHYVPSTKNVKSYVTPYPYSDRTLKKDLKKFKPNIIHIHSPFILGKYFLRYAKKHRIPCLLTFHTKYYLDFKRILKSTILSKIAIKSVVNLSNKVDYLFTVSNNMIEEMHSYGVKKYPINILENGSDLPVFKKHSCDDDINSKFKIPNNSFVIAFIGRIIKYKNLDLIINGAKILSKHTKNFKFLICGDGDDLSWMKMRVSNLNIDEFFIFTGLIERRELLAKIYNRADLNLMVSLFDSNSLTIYESASQYTPTILIKNSTVVNKNMIDKKNCYLSSLSPNKFANVIANAIKNRKRNFTIGMNANKDLYLNWNTICNKVFNIYKTIHLSWKD